MIAEPRRLAAPEPTPARIVVVEARYYEGIADELLGGAMSAIGEAGAQAIVLTVPGALEIPGAVVNALDAAADHGRPFDGIVALGCVIRGETGHYDIVAGESARALMDISVGRGVPVGNGILTVDTEAQAWARARRGEGDKGGWAASAALSLIRLKRALPARIAEGA